MTTAMEPGALTGILDIETPAAPLASGEVWLAVIAAVAVLTCLVYLAWRRRSSPSARARRRLAALQRGIDQRQIDGRRAAFELAAILREAFGVPHLSSASPSFRRMPESSAHWQEFLGRLSTARYAAQDTNPTQLGELIAAARQLLQQGLRHRP